MWWLTGLPKGYQISQFELPVCEHGWLDIQLEDQEPKRIGITRIHMEEDAGKSMHGDLLNCLIPSARSINHGINVISLRNGRQCGEQ